MSQRFFINRRSGNDRRNGQDQRQNPRLDLSHKRRRKMDDRRRINRNVSDDFYASASIYTNEQNHRPLNKH